MEELDKYVSLVLDMQDLAAGRSWVHVAARMNQPDGPVLGSWHGA